jgi:hypothetical protein
VIAGAFSGTGIINNAGTIDSTGTYGQLAIGAGLVHGGVITNSGGHALIEGEIGTEIRGPGTVVFHGTTVSVGGIGTLINQGTIASIAGSSGTAVLLGEVADILVDDAGSRFIGKVLGGGGTLELAGTSGTLSGLGSSFSGFGLVDVMAGADWSFLGTDFVASAGTSSLIDSGVLVLKGTSSVAGTVGGTGTLSFGGGTATIATGTDLLVQHLQVSSGSTEIGISLAYAGGFTESGGSLRLGGDVLTLDGAAAFTGGAIVGTGTLATHGATTLTALTVDGAAVWDNAATVAAPGTIRLGASGNGGTLDNLSGAVFDLTGNGGIAVSSGGSGTLVNAGLLEKTGGTGVSVIAAGIGDTGTIAIASGTLELAGGTNTLDGSISGAGTLQLGGGTTLLEGGTRMEVSHIKVSGGTTSLAGLDLIYDGNFVDSGGTISVTQYVMQLSGVNDFTGGTISGSGYLDTYGTSTSLGRLTLEDGAGWQVFGTVASTGVLVFANAALQLTVESDAVFDIEGSGGIVLASGGSGAIDNAGLLEKTVNTGVTTITPRIVDTGSIQIATGTLDFTGAGNSFTGAIAGAGTFEVGGGASTVNSGAGLSVAHLVLAGSSTQLALGASLAYAGSLTQSGGTLELGGTDLTLRGKASLAGAVTGSGTLTLAGTETLATGAVLSVSHLVQEGGSLTVAKNLTYNGSFLQSAGPIKVAGYTLVLNGSDTLTNGAVSGAGFLATYGAVGLANYTLNAGAVWQVFGATTATGSVTLGNGGGGTGRLAVAAGGSYDITANGGIVVAPGGSGTVGNFGLFEKTAGTGISTIAAAFTNSGTIVANAGALDLAAAVGGTGQATIGSAGALRFDGAVAQTQTIAFATTAGGRLVLNDPAGNGIGFAGSVTGFGGKDQLDLATFAFSGNPAIGWSQTSSSSGTLTVTDGSKVAKITLFGQYAQAGFGKAKDGGNGTTISYTTPAQVALLAAPHH